MSIQVTQVEGGQWRYYLYFRWPSKAKFLERALVPVDGLTKRRALEWVEQRRILLLQRGEVAWRQALEEKRQKVAGSDNDAGRDHTFSSFGPRYVKEWLLIEDFSEGTRDEYQRLLKSDVYPRFGPRALKDLKLTDIQKLKGDYLDEELSKKTINNVLTVISQMLKYAVKAEVLPSLPCSIQQFKSASPEMERYTNDVYDAVVEAARTLGPRYLVTVLLGGDAGLRLGEIVGLEWPDVDLRRDLLTVNRQERRGKVGPPKGGKTRSIPLTPRLRAALDGLQGYRTSLERRVLARDPAYRWDRHLDRVKDRTVRNWMELVQQRAGIEPNGRVHILRHTFCSRLVDAGAYPRDIQRLAGHASLSTTERYMHDSDDGKLRAIALLAGGSPLH